MDAAGVTPEAAVLARVADHAGLVILDFDETLLLRNSTEEFLNAAAPALLAAVLLRLLDLASPWRWAGGRGLRDAWRVRLITRLLPWTMARWRQDSPSKAAAWVNAPLAASVRGREVVVASNGFVAVIAPLLSAMGLDARLVACRNAADRKAGKLALLEAALGPERLAGALFVTDSIDDDAVLARVAVPCLVKWQGAEFRRALRRVYLPGDYLVYVKRPNVPGVARLLVTDDLAWWWLMAWVWRPSSMASDALLFLSFWCVYEIGYWENDVCARRYETDPVFTPEFLKFDTAWFEAKAWAAALLLGLAGGVRWFCVLLALRGVYYVYNRIDKASRVWLYLVLQGFRSLALAVIVPFGAVGVTAGLAQMVARWQGYAVYRSVPGAAWRAQPTRAVQLVFLIIAFSALILVHPALRVWTWQAAALVAWQGFLARKEVKKVIKQAVLF